MKAKWPGINAKGTVLINLPYETFQLSKFLVLIDDIYYAPKDELHVTPGRRESRYDTAESDKAGPKNQ